MDISAGSSERDCSGQSYIEIVPFAHELLEYPLYDVRIQQIERRLE